MLKKNYDASGVPFVTWYDPVKHRKVERYLYEFAPFDEIDDNDLEFLNLKFDPIDRELFVVFGDASNPNTWYNYMTGFDFLKLEDILRDYEKSLEEDEPAEDEDEEDEESNGAENGKDHLKEDSFIEISQRFSNIALEFIKLTEILSKLY